MNCWGAYGKAPNMTALGSRRTYRISPIIFLLGVANGLYGSYA